MEVNIIQPLPTQSSFSSGSEGKASACSAGRPGFNPWVRKTLWRRKDPLEIVPTQSAPIPKGRTDKARTVKCPW